MPRRSLPATTSYRFGFNGKENDNEVEGAGNQQDYGMRIYDPRVGRFLSIDPLTRSFSSLSPYEFGMNTPIQAIDLDGAQAKIANQYDGKELAITSIMSIWEVRNSVTNTALRLNPFMHDALLLMQFQKIGITDPELIKDFQLRMRTVVVSEEITMCLSCPEGSETTYTYSREWVIEPKNNLGKEMLEAGLDILTVGSVVAIGKGSVGSPVLFEKGATAVLLSSWRASTTILFNVRRMSSIGLVNGLKGVHKFADVMEAGIAFVGKNAKKIYSEGGRFIGWESTDGLRRFRPSAFKKQLGKHQANFEQRTSVDVKWDNNAGANSRSNMHVDTDQGFDYNAERITPPTPRKPKDK